EHWRRNRAEHIRDCMQSETSVLRTLVSIAKILAFIGLVVGAILVFLSLASLGAVPSWTFGITLASFSFAELTLAYLAAALAEGIDAQVSAAASARESARLLQNVLAAQREQGERLHLFLEQ